LEALHDAEIGRRAAVDGRLDLRCGVEVTAAVRIVGGERRVIVVERQGVHRPPAAPEAGIARRGDGDVVGLERGQIVDDLERAVRRRGGQIGRGADRAVQRSIDVDRWTGDAGRRRAGEQRDAGKGEDRDAVQVHGNLLACAYGRGRRTVTFDLRRRRRRLISVPGTRTDEELMAAYVAGEGAACRELSDRYAQILTGVLRRSLSRPDDARDLVQLTFLHVHRARNDYLPGAPFRPWLFTIALNLKREHFRRGARRHE